MNEDKNYITITDQPQFTLTNEIPNTSINFHVSDKETGINTSLVIKPEGFYINGEFVADNEEICKAMIEWFRGITK